MIVYNPERLRNFKLCEEASRWKRSGVITDSQLQLIEEAHPHTLYQPSLWLRILLFLATLLGLLALFGIIALGIDNANGDFEAVFRLSFLIVGTLCLVLLEVDTFKNKFHYKSGFTEALLFSGIGALFSGIFFDDGGEYTIAFAFIVIGLVLWLRYINLLGNLMILSGVSFLIFQLLYELGPSFQASIPFVFLILFSGIYLITSSYESRLAWYYQQSIRLLKGVLLVLIYLSVNYFVVRELSSEMMGLSLEQGEDIPLAFLFYAFTVLIPIGYLAYGIKNKRILFIRTGVGLLFASVITYKYYYSSGHPEISLTVAGIILTGITVWVLNKLKQPINGFTREKLLTQDGLNAHTESVIISSTMGGMQDRPEVENPPKMGGGQFGGGGAGSEF